MQPALIRQEAEGGVLLISALLRCMQAGERSFQLPRTGSASAQHLLHTRQRYELARKTLAPWQAQPSALLLMMLRAHLCPAPPHASW